MDKLSRLRFLFVKYLQRQCSAEEVDELALLMQETGSEDALHEELELLWEESADDKTQHDIDWEKMYNSVISRERQTDLLIHKATSRFRWIYYAVCIIFMLVIAFLLYRFLNHPSVNNKQEKDFTAMTTLQCGSSTPGIYIN